MHKKNKGVYTVLPIIVVVLTITVIAAVAPNFLNNSIPESIMSSIDSVNQYSSTNHTTVESVTKSTSKNAAAGVTVPGAALNVDTNSWYTDVKNVQGSTANPVDIGGFKAYPQPPWNTGPKDYFFNGIKAKEDLYDKLVASGADSSVPQGSKDFTMNNSFAKDVPYVTSIARGGSGGATGTKSCGAKFLTVDGLDCCYICPLPAMYFRDYVSSGNWGKTSWPSGYNWQTFKCCVVLTKKGNDLTDSSKYLYLPAVAGDAKAHTFPWGVTQTNVCIMSSTQVDGAGPSDHSQPMQVSNAGTDDAIKYVATHYNYSGYNILSYLYGTVELVGYTDTWFHCLKDNYTYVGWLVYK